MVATRTERRTCGCFVEPPWMAAATPSNLYLTSCFAGARATRNAEGIEKLAKGGEAGRRVKVRDDGAAASILAVGLGERRRGLLGRRVYHGAV